jgi:hypothetical protein
MSEVQVRSGWVGWALFAAVLLLIAAILDVFYGIVALFGPSTGYFVSSSGIPTFSLTAWGWWSIVLGLLMLIAGLSLMRGALWARIFAVFVAALHAIGQLIAFPAQPWWSIAMVTIDLLIIYAVTVHGRELRRD